MNPILRWAGGKKKLLADIQKLMPTVYHHYFEPFAGSAALFFKVLPQASTISDCNIEVITTYKAIQENPELVCQYLYSIPLTKEAYLEVRMLDPSKLNIHQRAARLVYLMKACFNGVYRTNKAGIFNVPLGSKFYPLPTRELIQEASIALKNTTLSTEDFQLALGRAHTGDFVYLDPPYSESTRFRGEYSYHAKFSSETKSRLISTCRDLEKRKVKVLLSYKDCDEISNALGNWSIKRIDVTRSVAGFGEARRSTTEILAYNY